MKLARHRPRAVADRRLAARLRPLLAALLGRPLAWLLLAAMRHSGRRVGVAVVYHALGERQGDWRRELVPALDQRAFAAQVAYLARRYALVAPSQLLAATQARKRGERIPAAITFDDDLASHRSIAAPVLRAAGAPAAFFLTGASLHRPFAFWWQDLQVAVDRGMPITSLLSTARQRQLEDGTIHAVGAAIEELPRSEREAIAQQLRDWCGGEEPDPGLSRDDIRALVADGFEIGFHTLRHERMPALDDVELERAFVDGRSRLADAAGVAIETVAYPHGRADERVAAAASEAGFAIGFTGAPLPVDAASDPLLLGRVGTSHESLGAFAAKLARVLSTDSRA